MNISRDVIIDLLPLYASGEASPATEELVRDYLARDPELARLARDHEAPIGTSPAVRTPDFEAISFQRTRGRVVSQRWAFGLAWLFTAVTFSTEIHIEAGHITSARLALADAPLLLGFVAAAAVISWLVYFNLRGRR
jgi:anti-sigma factor RsiW